MVRRFYQSETCENIKKSGFQLAGANHTRSMPDSYPQVAQQAQNPRVS